MNPRLLLGELGTVLAERDSRQSWWWGFVHRHMRVNRDEEDKNRALPNETWAGYPPYAVGALYALSRPLVRRVARVFDSGRLVLLRNEDQTMGLVMRRLGVVPLHSNLVQQWPFCSDRLVAIHPVSNHTHIAVAVASGLSQCHYIPRSNCPLCLEEPGCRPFWKKDWNCSE